MAIGITLTLGGGTLLNTLLMVKLGHLGSPNYTGKQAYLNLADLGIIFCNVWRTRQPPVYHKVHYLLNLDDLGSFFTSAAAASLKGHVNCLCTERGDPVHIDFRPINLPNCKLP